MLSATNLDVATGCASGVADVTAFGQLMPGTDNVTGSSCTVGFGSSNDASMLRAYRQYGLGTAMACPTDGSLDAVGFGELLPDALKATGKECTVTFDSSDHRRRD